MRRRIFKFLFYFLSALALSILIAGGISQTRAFKNWLRDRLISISRDSLNGELHIGVIGGNLLTRFTVDEIFILQNEDTVVFVPRLEVALQPLPLLRRELHLSTVALQTPRIFIKQQEDGSLNISHLMREKNGESSAALKIYLGKFSLDKASIEYISLDTLRQVLPRVIEIRRAEVHGSFVDDRFALNVDNLELETFLPGLEVKSMTAEIDASGDSLRLSDFKMTTANSKIRGDVAVQSLKNADFQIDVEIAPLLLDELHPFVPDLKASGAMTGRFNIIRSLGALRMEAEIEYREPASTGSATTANLLATLDEVDSTYSVEGVVRRLDLATLGIDSTNHSSINARFTAEGRRFERSRAEAHAVVWLDTSRVAGFHLPRFEMEARLDNGRLKTEADYFSPLGTAAADLNIEDFFGEPTYRFSVTLNKFDLVKFYESVTYTTSPKAGAKNKEIQPVLHTQLSLNCTGAGRSFDPKKVELSARLDAIASEIGIASIDTLTALVRVLDQHVYIDSLFWRGPTADFSAAGKLSFALDTDLRFRGQLDDLELIRRLVEADSLRADGWFAGTMSGTPDSLDLQADFFLQDVVWNNASMKIVNGHVNYLGTLKGGEMTADAGDLLLGVVPLDTATAKMQYDFDRVDFRANFSRGEDASGEVDGRYTFGDTARIDIESAGLFFIGQQWKNSDAPMWIEIGEEVYHLHNVILQSGDQRVWAEGRLDYLGEEDLQIGAENLNISNISTFMGRGEDFSGVLNASTKFLGSAASPLLRGEFDIRDGRLSEFRFPTAHGSMGYADNKFFWDVELRQNDDHALIGEGFLPMNLALDNHDDVLILDKPMRVQFNTNGLEVSFLQALFPKITNLQGALAFNIYAENTLSRLQPAGYVRIISAGFAIPSYGMQYRDIQLSAIVDTSSIELENFQMISGDGKFSADGSAQFRMDVNGITLSGVTASVRADNFMVVRNRDVDLRVNADVRMGGAGGQVGFAGDLIVIRSRFFLPALQATTVMKIDDRQLATDASQKVSATAALDTLFHKIYGELRVLIPRKTWLRGPELNVEIEGELDLLVHEGEFLLFGPITVVRGTYELYGKKFTIDQGALTFQGAKDMLPEINFDASRVFRNTASGLKQVLSVNITGRSDAPKIAFKLDDQAIEDQDAFAYLLVGVSFGELTQSQKSDFSGQAAASGLLSGLVSKQINDALAKGLNLDVIEFQSGENQPLRESRVLVGKYITNDLFLSYSRDFSSADAQKVSLEYEIAKFLFLQAAKSNEKDTGFDVIWKWEW